MPRRLYHVALPLLALLIVLTLLPEGVVPQVVTQLPHRVSAAEVFDAAPFLEPRRLPGKVGLAGSMATGDLNGDGHLDIVSGNEGIPSQVYLNDGYGTFKVSRELVGSDGSATSMRLGDIDRDGDLDILLGNYNKPAQVFWNNGKGDFLEVLVLRGSQRGARSVALGDLDGDSDLDILLGNVSDYDPECECISPSPSQVYRNDGRGGFAEPVNLPGTEQGASNIAIGDLNGDDKIDIIIEIYNGLEKVFLNDGSGDFTAPFDLSNSSNGIEAMALGDLDGDGDLDLFLINSIGPSQIYWNDGRGTFRTPLDLQGSDSSTRAVALGDLNGDSALDIVLGNYDRISQVYLNDGRGAFTTPLEVADSDGSTRSLALGDINGDGALDLVLGNDFSASQVYVNASHRNVGAILDFEDSGRGTRTVVLGDFDGNDTLDLVFGNDYSASQVYLNQGRGIFGAPSDLLGSFGFTRAIAVGDLDGDTDLDLALANYDLASQVYLNNGHGVFGAPFTLADSGFSANSIALGDLDGDVDLDIVLGQAPSLVYLNNGGGKFAAPIFLPWDGTSPSSVTLGDLDGDGDLDLLLANYFSSSHIYWNDGKGRFATRFDLPGSARETTSAALGDLNGDAALDIILGNESSASQVYLNDGKGAFTDSFDLLGSRRETSSIALQDLDGNDALDILITNSASASQVYLNNSKGEFAGPFDLNGTSDGTRSLVLGTFDDDNSLDLVLGKYNNISQIILRHNGFTGQLEGTPPTIRISQPGVTNAAPLYATAEIFSGRYLAIPFTLADTEGDPVAMVRGEYSLDGGSDWRPAMPANLTTTKNLTTSSQGITHTFTWDIYADGGRETAVFGSSDNVLFRIIATPSFTPHQNQVAGSYTYSGVRVTSQPFRIRGTQARVIDSAGRPVENALVYRLPSGNARGALSLTRRLSGAPSLTNYLGYVASRDPLRPGDRLAALQVLSDTAKYTLYHTSPISIATGLLGHITSTGVQTLTISPEHPLIAFKLSVSLEWDARNDQSYLLQLRRDLARASELLYDWSDGQAALGQVILYHDKQHWEDSRDQDGKLIPGADIQIVASNRLRPNAVQGGIVTAPLTETVTIDGKSRQVTYDPGAVRMPVTWNRNGEPGGVFGEDWPRTLAHELAHFALFLDDNYLGLDAQSNLVTLTGCRGAMSNPYRDDWSELHPPGAMWDSSCATTLSERATGRSDWETILRFYRFTKASDGVDFTPRAPSQFAGSPGPSRLALALLELDEVEPIASTNARDFALSLVAAFAGDNEGVYTPSPAARAILYRGDGGRATDLGAPTGDLVRVRGGRSGDTLCVYDAPLNLVGCISLSDLSTRLVLHSLPDWQPDLRITVVSSATLRLAVPMVSIGLKAPSTLQARFFPDEGIPVTVTLRLANNVYVGTTPALATPPLGGLVRLWVPGEEGEREAVAEYSLGGEPAPRRRKKRRNRRRAPALSADGQAILFTDNLTFKPGQFFAFQTVDRLPPPPSWAVPIGLGYRLLASDTTIQQQIPQSALALGYFDSDVPLRAEDGVQVYFYPDGGNAWQPLPTNRSLEDNTASARPPGPGLYALMASVPLHLSPGWNQIFAYPGASQPLPAALSGAIGRYQLVYGYDEDDEGDPWKVHAPSLAPPWDNLVNDLPRLENGVSYWFRAGEGSTLPVRPVVNTPSLTVDVTGGNALPAPPATYYGLAPGGSPYPLAVEAYVGEGESGTLCGTTTTKPIMVNGRAAQSFSVNVLAYGGEAEGCGVPGAAVQLVFRNGDNVVGTVDTFWNNSALTIIGANQLHLPVIGARDEPRPDLQVVGIRVAPAPTGSSEAYELLVMVRNTGSEPIDTPFWVDLYVDPERPPNAGEGWPDVAEFGASWRVVDGVAAGATLTLSSLSPNDPSDPGRNYTRLPALQEGEAYTLYVQADVFDPSNDGDGQVAELNEANNIAGPFRIVPE